MIHLAARDELGSLSLTLIALLVGCGLVLAGVSTSVGIVRLGQGEEWAVREVKPDVPVTPMDLGMGPSNNSPVLAADPDDPRFVVMANRLDAPDFGCALQVSGDGGQGWRTADAVSRLPPGVDKCYAPEVAFDNNGVLYYLFVGLAGRGNEPVGAYLVTSVDQTRTFSAPHLVLGPLNFGVRMIIDQTLGKAGRIHLVWLHATSDPPVGSLGPPPNPILAAHSDDGGQTFSEPVQVSDPDRRLVVAPTLAVGPNHEVSVAYYDLGDDVRDYQGLEGPTWEGTWSIVLARSTDGGRHFARGRVVDDSIVAGERVMLIFTMPPPALVNVGERICVAWADARNGDPDALLRCSTDGGISWADLRRLNDDQMSNGVRQYLPRLAVTPDGRLGAAFFDRRDDPENVHNHVYYTYSVDGGVRFEPNIRLTRYDSHSQVGQRYAGPAAKDQYEFGSRLGLLSWPNGTIAAWPDTRNARIGSTNQDIFATKIDFDTTVSQPLAIRLIGFLLVGAGLLVVAVVALRRHRERGSTSMGSG